MNVRTLLPLGAALLVGVAGCGSDSSSGSGSGSTEGGTTSSTAESTVLPVEENPITNTSTNAVLEVTYAALEDNVDPETGDAIDDCLELTLRNTGTEPLTDLEVYYEFTDVTTGDSEGYHQELGDLEVPAGGETTVFFDNQTGAGHYPENEFSIYRSSANQVDVAVQVSAPAAQVATATASKEAGTDEEEDD
jgi:hypothetical protein